MSFRRIYTLILGLQLCLLSYGQSYQKEIYKAYVDYEVNRWLKAAKYVENSNQNQTEKMLNLIHCYYGYTSSLMSLKQNDEAEKIIEKAEIFGAKAVYVRKQLGGSYKPQVFLFDFTAKDFFSKDEKEITAIQKKIWSSGEAPLACLFYKTEIKIIDCTKHITDEFKPEYLVETLKLTEKIHLQFIENFAALTIGHSL